MTIEQMRKAFTEYSTEELESFAKILEIPTEGYWTKAGLRCIKRMLREVKREIAERLMLSTGRVPKRLAPHPSKSTSTAPRVPKRARPSPSKTAGKNVPDNRRKRQHSPRS